MVHDDLSLNEGLSDFSFHIEIRRKGQLESRQKPSTVEKGARRRTMRSFFTLLVIVACTISCDFSNAQESPWAQTLSPTPEVTATPGATAQPQPSWFPPDKSNRDLPWP
jgi:hypothetical protein